MYSEQYESLSLNMLNDTSYYVPLSSDLTMKVQNKSNQLVSELKSQGKMDQNLAKSLTGYNSLPPSYHGLPKIHKDELSLSPMVSSVSSPDDSLSSWLTNILTISYNNNNPYFIEDSFQLAELITGLQLSQEEVLVSLDVVPLFSNIPYMMVENSISNKWSTMEVHSPMNLEDFLSLVKFLLDSAYCLYNGVYYHQMLGTLMGASMSPIMSQFVMDEVMDDCLSRLSFTPNLLKKYVDDIIM